MQAFSATAGIYPYDGNMPAGRPSINPRTSFGQRLYDLRIEKGLSQKQTAEKLNLAQQSYAEWERNPTALKPEQLALLADILKTTVDYLVGHKVEPQRKGGPVGKARKVFEEVNKLPRHQQNKVAEFVEAFVERQINGHKKTA